MGIGEYIKPRMHGKLTSYNYGASACSCWSTWADMAIWASKTRNFQVMIAEMQWEAYKVKQWWFMATSSRKLRQDRCIWGRPGLHTNAADGRAAGGTPRGEKRSKMREFCNWVARRARILDCRRLDLGRRSNLRGCTGRRTRGDLGGVGESARQQPIRDFQAM